MKDKKLVGFVVTMVGGILGALFLPGPGVKELLGWAVAYLGGFFAGCLAVTFLLQVVAPRFAHPAGFVLGVGVVPMFLYFALRGIIHDTGEPLHPVAVVVTAFLVVIAVVMVKIVIAALRHCVSCCTVSS